MYVLDLEADEKAKEGSEDAMLWRLADGELESMLLRGRGTLKLRAFSSLGDTRAPFESS